MRQTCLQTTSFLVLVLEVTVPITGSAEGGCYRVRLGKEKKGANEHLLCPHYRARSLGPFTGLLSSSLQMTKQTNKNPSWSQVVTGVVRVRAWSLAALPTKAQPPILKMQLRDKGCLKAEGRDVSKWPHWAKEQIMMSSEPQATLGGLETRFRFN